MEEVASEVLQDMSMPRFNTPGARTSRKTKPFLCSHIGFLHLLFIHSLHTFQSADQVQLQQILYGSPHQSRVLSQVSATSRLLSNAAVLRALRQALSQRRYLEQCHICVRSMDRNVLALQLSMTVSWKGHCPCSQQCICLPVLPFMLFSCQSRIKCQADVFQQDQ